MKTDEVKSVSFSKTFTLKDLFWIAPCFIILMFSLYLIIVKATLDNSSALIGIWFFFLIIFLLIIIRQVQQIENTIWQSFLSSHQFIQKATPSTPQISKYSIFQLGIRREIDNYYTNNEAEIFFLTAHTSDNPKMDATTTFKIFTIHLKKLYPFSQAIQKGRLDILGIKPKIPGNSQLHGTESIQFNKNYDLNAEKPQDAFYVFNPKVIGILSDNSDWFSVEICNDYVAIFTTKEIRTIDDYNTIWQKLEQIRDTLNV